MKHRLRIKTQGTYMRKIAERSLTRGKDELTQKGRRAELEYTRDTGITRHR